jgi:uncharacterized protein YdeI (YjbR/CyaY-like superfamily)
MHSTTRLVCKPPTGQGAVCQEARRSGRWPKARSEDGGTEMKIRFFKQPADFRKWLEKHHGTARELVVGFYKKGSGKPSITWPESVDEALCFGWIDGVRRRIDDVSYTIRFTPRKPISTWSAVNIKRVRVLAGEGRMQPSGSKAFDARRANRSGIYSYEQRPGGFDDPYRSRLRRKPIAWAFFDAQPPSYKRAAIWWVVSAKKEETRLRRLEKLIQHSAAGETIPQFTRRKP